MKFTILIMLSLALLGVRSTPITKVVADPTRTIEIIDSIDGSIAPLAERLDQLSSQSQEPIWLLINSPGGSVIAGTIFTSAMDVASARGVTIKCVVPVLAASMAFSILAHCSERYAFEDSLLLFHPAALPVRAVVKAEEAQDIADGLNRINTHLIKYLIQSMGMNSVLFLKSFKEERLWSARELKEVVRPGWITIISDVRNMPNLFKITKDRSSPFQEKSK